MQMAMRIVGFSMSALGLGLILLEMSGGREPSYIVGCLLLTTGLVGVTGPYKGEARGGTFVNRFVISGALIMFGAGVHLLTTGRNEGFAIMYFIMGSLFIWSARSRLQWHRPSREQRHSPLAAPQPEAPAASTDTEPGQATMSVPPPAPVSALPLDAMPKAEPRSVIRWLRRMRIAALLALALPALHALYAVLATYGVDLGLPVRNAQGSLSCIIGAVGLWLFTSPEPGNPQWLRLRRWVLRIAIVLTLLSVAASWVAYVITGSFQEEAEASAYDRIATIVFACFSLCLYSYLRAVAHRLRDGPLQKTLTVLVVLFIVGGMLLVGASLGIDTFDASSRPSSTMDAPGDASHVSATGVLVFWLIIFAWHGWILWRFAQRLRDSLSAVAERQTVPVAGVPTRDGSP